MALCSHILVEGCPIHSDREHWKRTCVAEGGDYESAMDLSPRGGREAVGCRTQRHLGSRYICRSLLMPEPWEGGRKGGEACSSALRLATWLHPGWPCPGTRGALETGLCMRMESVFQQSPCQCACASCVVASGRKDIVGDPLWSALFPSLPPILFPRSLPLAILNRLGECGGWRLAPKTHTLAAVVWILSVDNWKLV